MSRGHTWTHRASDRIFELTGHRFQNPALLEAALTHRSHWEGGPGAADYQRLEFLGDAIVNLAATLELFERCPEHAEGKLTAERQRLINTHEAFARLSRQLGLSDLVRTGAGESRNIDGQNKIFGDLVESVAGALAMDAGIELALRVTRGWIRELREELAKTEVQSTNPKGDLQELLQRSGRSAPKYDVTGKSGPDHAPEFTVDVTVDGARIAEGRGRSRQDAEKQAAFVALGLLRRQQAGAERPPPETPLVDPPRIAPPIGPRR